MIGPEISLQEISTAIGATLVGEGNVLISGVADLEKALPSELSFYSNPRYHQKMLQSSAGAIIVPPTCEREVAKNYLIHESPSEAFQTALLLFPQLKAPLSGFSGIHKTAIIHPSATIGVNVVIAPYAVIDQNVHIHDDSYIGAFVYIGSGSCIGKKTHIHAHAVIREGSILGDRVIIQPGAVIGSCGYGYVTDKIGQHHKLIHVGNVVLENDVEIGANTTIDRARFDATIVGEGTKIDNLVQIAHNVKLGKHNLIIAQVGIAGSAELGNHVVLGGKVAVNGHITICDKVRVTACSGISKSITSSGDYGGVPVQILSEYNRNTVYLRKIGEVFQRLAQLEQKVEPLL
jgi:UDP-3-O-[3-hydroxymyristoyl] glucosamine N-acyltransferase